MYDEAIDYAYKAIGLNPKSEDIKRLCDELMQGYSGVVNAVSCLRFS